MIKLSKKEQQIADLLCTGLMQKEIARKLKIKESTVATHRSNILKKTGKSTIKELMFDEIIDLRKQIKELNREIKRLKVFEQRWNYLKEMEFLRRSY